VLADRGSVGDVHTLRRTAGQLGASVRLADLALEDGTPRHDPVKLASALSMVLAGT
jgi:hypothetical protein